VISFAADADFPGGYGKPSGGHLQFCGVRCLQKRIPVSYRAGKQFVSFQCFCRRSQFHVRGACRLCQIHLSRFFPERCRRNARLCTFSRGTEQTERFSFPVQKIQRSQ